MKSLAFIVRNLRSCLRICFLVCFALGATAAFGQPGRGSIRGTVTDPGGAVVSGAQVTLLDPATAVTQHTVTSGAGLYSFISLNPGVYRVTVSQTGFASVAVDK